MTEFEYREAVEIDKQLKELHKLNHVLSDDKTELVGIVIRYNGTDKSVILKNYKKIEVAPETIKAIVLKTVRNRIMLLKSKFKNL